MRFTLSKLFLVVSMVALACAGMTLRTHWWSCSILSATIALFVVVAIRAVGQRGRDRAFAVAFPAVGLGYLLLLSSNLYEPLITNLPLAMSARAMQLPSNVPTMTTLEPVPPQMTSQGNGEDSFGGIATAVMTERPLTLDEYVRFASRPDTGGTLGAFFLVGHCVWSWLFGLLAGWFAGNIYAKREGFQKA